MEEQEEKKEETPAVTTSTQAPAETTTTTGQTQTGSLPSTTINEGKNQYKSGNMYNDISTNVPSTEDTAYSLKKKGETVAGNIDAARPRHSVMTSLTDILKNPEMKGKALPYILDVLANSGLAATSNQKQKTALGNINEVLNEQYAKDLADKNTRAMNAEIEPQEAAIKEFTDLELRLRDTAANAYIDRYNASQSAETKRMVLEQMINDADVWASLGPEDKIDLLSYVQALDGNGSLISMAIQMWAPELMDRIDAIINGEPIFGGKSAKANEDKVFNIGGKQVTSEELTNVWKNSPDTVKKWLENIVDAEGNPDWVAQQNVVDDILSNYTKQFGQFNHPGSVLQKDLNQRKATWEGNQKVEEDAANRRKLWLQGWQTQYTDLLDRLKDMQTYKSRKDEVKGALNLFENEMLQNGYVATDDEETLKANLEKLKADIEKGEIAKAFDNTVEKALKKQKGDNEDSVLERLATLDSTYSPDYLMNTYGAMNVINYLADKRKEYDTKSGTQYNKYNTALANIQSLFGLTNDDLKKYEISKLQYKR